MAVSDFSLLPAVPHHLYYSHDLKPTVLEVVLPELIWSLNEQTLLGVNQRGRRIMLGARQMNITGSFWPKDIEDSSLPLGEQSGKAAPGSG